ncbi:hypothetical protein [Rhodopirellula bahusiensis]|uniref:Uncharacterized protein n=1 Tax=Rhodopirellula bahusiensis TaxID=2014065 RepID=A0A2G1W548_9BACT|nr:hypothetical protein [Rhodopirellula bahusiensis]PHQ34168.1 hypothetical protein CEE69_16080 [Rhodopirellula bahusiensis]
MSVLRRRQIFSGGFAANLIACSGPDEPPTEIEVVFRPTATQRPIRVVVVCLLHLGMDERGHRSGSGNCLDDAQTSTVHNIDGYHLSGRNVGAGFLAIDFSIDRHIIEFGLGNSVGIR